MHPRRVDISLRLRQFSLLVFGAALLAGIPCWQLADATTLEPPHPPGDQVGTILQTLNLQTATVAELALLPEMGRSLAGAVVRYRDQLAAAGKRFSHIEELLAVRGIGPNTLQRIRPYLRIPAETP